MFCGPSFIVSTMQEGTTPIFKRLWYDWTQQQPGIEPRNPLGQCWVPPILAFYDQQGILRTYSLPGGSIRSSHPGSPQEPPPRIPKWYLMVNPQPPTLMRTLNQLDQSLLTLIPLFIDVLMAGVHLRLILYCSFGYFCPADVGKTPQKVASSFGGFNAD